MPWQREQREQQEDHLAGEQVAVQTQRERERPREEGYDLEQQVGGDQQDLDDRILGHERLQGEFGEEAAEALHLDAVVDDEHEYRQRHREGDVEVRARNDLQVLEPGPAREHGQQVHRQDVHRVEEEHPAEDRQARGASSLLVPWKLSLTWRVDEFDDQLDEVLEFARARRPWPCARRGRTSRRTAARAAPRRTRCPSG